LRGRAGGLRSGPPPEAALGSPPGGSSAGNRTDPRCSSWGTKIGRTFSPRPRPCPIPCPRNPKKPGGGKVRTGLGPTKPRRAGNRIGEGWPIPPTTGLSGPVPAAVTPLRGPHRGPSYQPNCPETSSVSKRRPTPHGRGPCQSVSDSTDEARSPGTQPRRSSGGRWYVDRPPGSGAACGVRRGRPLASRPGNGLRAPWNGPAAGFEAPVGRDS